MRTSLFQAPSWLFGVKHGKMVDDASPGPVHYPDVNVSPKARFNSTAAEHLYEKLWTKLSMIFNKKVTIFYLIAVKWPIRSLCSHRGFAYLNIGLIRLIGLKFGHVCGHQSVTNRLLE